MVKNGLERTGDMNFIYLAITSEIQAVQRACTHSSSFFLLLEDYPKIPRCSNSHNTIL